MKNTLKEKLARGEKPLGTFVSTGSAAVVECLGCTGLDFVILDNEHSPIEAETTATLVRAAECRGLTPLARVREISRPAILKLLDVGVQGLIIPDVRGVEDARRIIRCAKYAPLGQRGFCPSRKDAWVPPTWGPSPRPCPILTARPSSSPSAKRRRPWLKSRPSPPCPGWTAFS